MRYQIKHFRHDDIINIRNKANIIKWHRPESLSWEGLLMRSEYRIMASIQAIIERFTIIAIGRHAAIIGVNILGWHTLAL